MTGYTPTSLKSASRASRRIALVLLMGCALSVSIPRGVGAAEATGYRAVTVMTQNMDAGTGFGQIFSATSFPAFVTAVGSTYQEVQASGIPERATAVAQEIGQAEPDVVGLQEVSLWRTGPLFSPPATTVAYDQLQSLLSALAQQGLHYAPIAIATNSDVEAPSSLGIDVRTTDRDVILARTGLPTLTVSNIQMQHFVSMYSTPTLVGPVANPRSWIAVDVTRKGHTVRFVTTHLEPLSSATQVAQVQELIQGLGTTHLPVVLAGDFNADAGSGSLPQTATYGDLLSAGYVDAWSATNPGKPGYTWPLHGEDPFTPISSPTDRIDWILARNGVRAVDTELVGNRTADLRPSGLWPSDHAGVVATLLIP